MLASAKRAVSFGGTSRLVETTASSASTASGHERCAMHSSREERRDVLRRRRPDLAHGVDGHGEILQLVPRDARDLRAEHHHGVRRPRQAQRRAEGAHQALALVVLEENRREPPRRRDRVRVRGERALEHRRRLGASLRNAAEAVVVVGPQEELRRVDQVPGAHARLDGELREGPGGGQGGFGVHEPACQARDRRRCRDRQLIEAQRVAVARERLARHVLGGHRLGRLVGRGLQQERQAKLEREARVVVGGERHEGAERADDGLARARVAAARVGQLAPERRVERAGVRRIELEDGVVGLRGVADREAPLLERREVPERSQAGARVVQGLALLGEHARQRSGLARAAPEVLQRPKRGDVIRLLGEQGLEQRRGARGLLVQLHQQRRQLERHGLRRARRRRPLDAFGQQRRQLAEPTAHRVLPSPGHDARQALGHEVVVRRLRQRPLVRAERRRVVTQAQLVDLGGASEVTRPVLGR
jgi:hypothetical protein